MGGREKTDAIVPMSPIGDIRDPTAQIEGSALGSPRVVGTVADEIVPELRYAGVRVPFDGHTGAEYWQDFVELAGASMSALT